MPESDLKSSETATPHVVYASEYPIRPWREPFPDRRDHRERSERIVAIRQIRETLKRAG